MEKLIRDTSKRWKCENCGKEYEMGEGILDPIKIAEILGAEEITNVPSPNSKIPGRIPSTHITTHLKKSKFNCCANPKIVRKKIEENK